MKMHEAIDAALAADRRADFPVVVYRISDEYYFSETPPEDCEFVAWVHGRNIATFDGRISMRWVNVLDGSPEPGKDVLVYTHGVDFSGEQFFHVRSDEFYGYDDGGCRRDIIDAATHWAELPYPEDV